MMQGPPLNLYPALPPGECVTCFPPPNKISQPRRQSQSFTPPQPLSLVSLTFSRPEERIWVGGGPRKSPAVGNCTFLWCVGGLTSWRAASKKAGLRAKLKLLPLLCMLPSFLTRPQSTLPPDCTSTPSIETDQLTLQSGCVLGYMLTTHMACRSSLMLPVGESLYGVDVVQCTDWLSGTPQVSRLLWFLRRYKGTVSWFMSVPLRE